MIEYKPKLNAWRPDSSHDEHIPSKDYDFSNLKPALTKAGTAYAEEIDLRKYCSPVENQGQAGSCVANAAVSALEMLMIKNNKPYVDLSRLFIYYNARLMANDHLEDNGSYIYLAFGTLSSLGTCAEKTWPYDLKTLFTRPSWGAYREGYANKIHEYYKIKTVGVDRVNDIKAALNAEHPVVFGMIVDEDFAYVGDDGIISMPKPNRNILGGHAMLIVGYTKDNHWIVRNSWGQKWGDNGYCYIPFGYLDVSYASDLWVATVAK